MKNRNGFTLIELLAVMAIVGILAGLILGVSSYASRKASESRAIADMERLKTALEEYKIEFGAYPDNTPPNQTIVMAKYNSQKTGTIPNPLFTALTNYVSEVVDLRGTGTDTSDDVWFQDPWGSFYRYKKENDFSFVLVSYGADMADGGGDDLSTATNYK